MPPKKRGKQSATTRATDTARKKSAQASSSKAPAESIEMENGIISSPSQAAVSPSSATNPAVQFQGKGLTLLPSELISIVLSHFRCIGPSTDIRTWSETPAEDHSDIDSGPTLSAKYLERSDALRSLSQVCREYRSLFLPLLHERLEACITSRPRDTQAAVNTTAHDKGPAFYRHVGEALERKCGGYKANPTLADMLRIANVSITRYKTATILSTFALALPSFTNLHTIHILHAHTQMTTHIQKSFSGQDITLPSIRKLIIPGMCHELMKVCPEVRSVWCTTEGGSKLVGVMGKFCKKVEEVKGFWFDDNLMKRLVKAAPNLRVIEVSPESESPAADPKSSDMLGRLSALRYLNTIYIAIDSYQRRADVTLESKMKDSDVARTIKKCRSILRGENTKVSPNDAVASSSKKAPEDGQSTRKTRGGGRKKADAMAAADGGDGVNTGEKTRKYLRLCFSRPTWEEMDAETQPFLEVGLGEEPQ